MSVSLKVIIKIILKYYKSLIHIPLSSHCVVNPLDKDHKVIKYHKMIIRSYLILIIAIKFTLVKPLKINCKCSNKNIFMIKQ